jgi:AhpD family alkylhydroperoxidase
MSEQARLPEPPGGWLEGSVRLPLAETSDSIRGHDGWISWLIYKVARFDAANLFRLLATNPGLFFPWLWLAARLNPYGSLPRTDTEIVVLRVAWNCRCRYEWEHHVTLARGAGVEREEIERVPLGPETPLWSPRRRALLAAADELHASGRVEAGTWERLGTYLNRQQLLELCLLIGSYDMLAGVINSAGVPVDERVERQVIEILGRPA